MEKRYEDSEYYMELPVGIELDKEELEKMPGPAEATEELGKKAKCVKEMQAKKVELKKKKSHSILDPAYRVACIMDQI